jgi:hypothetical protein
MGGDWWLVNQQASDLVLAYIADRLAALKGWTSLTDSEICYLFTAASSSDISPSPNIAENHLARVIVTELVPDVIDMLSLDKYCELRARYEPIRERLAIFMNEVVVENRLGQIGDPGELSGAVHDCIKDLKTEILSFRESTFGKAFRKWGPFSLGSLISLATPIAHLDPTWTIPLAGASLLVRAVDKAGFLEHKVTNRTEMVRLLASARTDIISSLDIKRFLVA